jgi:acyl-CoA synthetase (AMP-forming)/AMP-acid ligase II
VSAEVTANIASWLPYQARRQPHTVALFFPHTVDRNGRVAHTHATYAQLDHDSDIIAAGLQAVGIDKGRRVALMVKPSLEFFALTFAIFKTGAVPVLVDPGIGLKHLKACLGEAQPEAFIGIPEAHAARVLLGWAGATVKTLVTVGPRWFWGGLSLEDVKARGRAAPPFQMAETDPTDMAAVLFTSGATGVPKGAIYTHGTFLAQVDIIRETYDIRPGEIDLPTFPLFALFDPALGMTTVIPDMDFAKPASVDPRKIIAAIEDFGVTNMFGSPALLDTVSRYGAAQNIRLPTLKRVISAGAPVSPVIIERVMSLLEPDALLHTPYGATESLPVASISSETILGETREATDRGAGICVGRPVSGAEVRIIRITDKPITEWSDELLVGPDEVGEITVRGPMVSLSYWNRPAATEAAKIRDGETIIHRMGDLGYFDEQGRLWFCGRKAHRVATAKGTLFTDPCEGVFNTHPAVRRTALVALQRASGVEPAICVELEADRPAPEWSGLVAELAQLGAAYPHTREIHHFLRHPGFPVDIRHNAKIDREKLSVWATARLQ